MRRRILTAGLILMFLFAAPATLFAEASTDSMTMSVTIMSVKEDASFASAGMQVPMTMAGVGMALIVLASPIRTVLLRRHSS